jgi:hypothetical protein
VAKVEESQDNLVDGADVILKIIRIQTKLNRTIMNILSNIEPSAILHLSASIASFLYAFLNL